MESTQTEHEENIQLLAKEIKKQKPKSQTSQMFVSGAPARSLTSLTRY
jgi:hypothetical protein